MKLSVLIGLVVITSACARSIRKKLPHLTLLRIGSFTIALVVASSGDVFKFLEGISSDSFQESVKVLADRLGIAVSIDVQGKFSGKILLIKLFMIFMRMRLSFTTQSS